MSANGNRLLVGDPTGSAEIYNVSNNSIEFTLQGLIHAKLSPSGRYIWYIEKESTRLVRYDIDNKKFFPFKLLIDKNESYRQIYIDYEWHLIKLLFPLNYFLIY